MYLRCNSICHSQERKEQTYIMYIVVSSRTLIVPCQSPWLFHSPKSPDLLQLIMVMEFVHNLFWTWLYPRQDYDAHSEDGFASQYNPDSQLLCHGKFQAKQCAHSCFSFRVNNQCCLRPHPWWLPLLGGATPEGALQWMAYLLIHSRATVPHPSKHRLLEMNKYWNCEPIHFLRDHICKSVYDAWAPLTRYTHTMCNCHWDLNDCHPPIIQRSSMVGTQCMYHTLFYLHNNVETY